MPEALYTADNIKLAYELRWSLSIFWTHPAPDPLSWLPSLQKVTEPDGVRLLEHRCTKNNVSQFLLSTKPDVTPSQCIRSIKGRLQYLVRDVFPKAFRRNYSIHSIGHASCGEIEHYVQSQQQHHPMADSRVEAILAPFQFVNENCRLDEQRRSNYGEFIYNLHLVAVHQERYVEIREDWLRRTFEMVQAVARKKEHLLSRLSVLGDHLHWTIGCDVQESPLEIGLSYLDNLAFAHGMRPVFQCGFYVGTFGRYDMNAVREKKS